MPLESVHIKPGRKRAAEADQQFAMERASESTASSRSGGDGAGGRAEAEEADHRRPGSRKKLWRGYNDTGSGQAAEGKPSVARGLGERA
jgi:hypothetical protein